ncbi:TWiK family of potassium channels protein 7-like isoform X2 [Cimex lectularius]|nr:TWiK family of potassium channels protein 7-like isoform X2 [Cimex lectularius]XP_024083889.1 TWiK family of potassium channels protein 7-like isoform X2 [Cimex lectularius]XP_024083891.1 TWiK family of potassium channels protein 7-like isoform X2 [Cimex lectularius]XP_024083892.1 TWiK family of potassium channels protein 7-like isoform X2 [Cimex lectularius]XP_024083893.1 TWiK family of potassium channels protein 7-like isoform X2 [Cimex lectularius]XP_024083894.1 TWiK family of potassium 
MWKMTQEMEVLRYDNWTINAEARIRDFEKELVKAIKKGGWDGSEGPEALQWTFAGSLFYSIIVITTIGYGHIAPKTKLGKVTTIFYAIVGIPLMLLCLSNIGTIMANSFRFLYWKVFCYSCTKIEKRRNSARRKLFNRQTINGAYRLGKDDLMNVYEIQDLNVDPQFQQQILQNAGDEQPIQSRQSVIINKYALENETVAGKQAIVVATPGPLERGGSSVKRGQDPGGHITRMNSASTKSSKSKGTSASEFGEDVQPQVRPVPIWLCVFLVVSYIIGGAFLFSDWEDWNYGDSAYFCFITLTTIGFGDFVPAQKVNKKNGEIGIALCSLYLLFGIALLAMSFNLVQEEVINNVKAIGRHLGIIKDESTTEYYGE